MATETSIDITIFLSPPILKDGGVIIVIPKEEDTSTEEIPRKRSATVTSSVSVVEFTHNKGQTYSYRFRSSDEENYPSTKLLTKKISVGTHWDHHPRTGEEVEIGPVLVHHFQTRSGHWTETMSRKNSDVIPLGFLKEHYTCTEFPGVLTCDAADWDDPE